MKCPKCATENSNTAKFCKGCGFDVQQSTAPKVSDPAQLPLCPKCNASYPPGAKFCKACGTSTATAAPVVTLSPESVQPARTTALAPLPPSTVAAPQAAKPHVSPPLVTPPSSPETRPEAVPDILNSARLPPKTPPTAADTKTASGTTPRKSTLNPVDSAPVSVDPQIHLKSKKTGPNRYVIGGSALAAILVFAGVGAYWFSSSNAKPSAEPLVKQISTPATVATPAASVPVSTPGPKTAEVAVSPALLESPATAVPVEDTAATKTKPTSGLEAKPAKESEPTPPATTPVVNPKPSIAEDQRSAKEAAIRKRAEREALANQRARDKERLNKTNRTLDDLLK